MGNHTVLELEIDEGDVGNVGNDAPAAGRADVERSCIEPVAEHGEVVRAEVPGDAHVRLVEAEVHSTHRDEVDVPELAGQKEVANAVHRRAVQERVPGHQYEAALLGERGELGRLGGRRGQRLLDEDVLAGAESLARELVVCRHRRGDRNGFDVIRIEDFLEVARGVGTRVPPRQLRERIVGGVAEAHHLRGGVLLQVPDQIRPPVAEADHRDADRLGHLRYQAACTSQVQRHQAVPPDFCRRTWRGVWNNSHRSSFRDQPRAYATSMSSASPKVA